MRGHRSAITVLLATIAAVASTGCDSGTAQEADRSPDALDPATTSVLVENTDSSVPPRYHRSWVFEADESRALVKVDSYGDPIAERDESMPDAVWRATMADLAAVAAMDDATDGDCAGGTAVEITVQSGEETSRVRASSCSDEGVETGERILEVVEPLTDIVDLERLTAT